MTRLITFRPFSYFSHLFKVFSSILFQVFGCSVSVPLASLFPLSIPVYISLVFSFMLCRLATFIPLRCIALWFLFVVSPLPYRFVVTLSVTNRGTIVTGDKWYHGIYVVHQTERVVLSDDSVLRYAMSQRQADTQNTKSNTFYIPA